MTEPNRNEAAQQRIELATRLMEAWLRGENGNNDPSEINRKAAQFAKAAATIQQEAA